MTKLSGGDAIVEGLSAHGIKTVFGLPGAQIYGLFDAFERADMTVIGARHEQGCGYMAFGAARSTGRPAVYAVVPGPGILNAGAAALTSLGCNEPVLCLTGQTPTSFLDRGHGHLHEMPDQLGTLRSMFKHAERIEHPADAPALVAQAFQQMNSGRRGPAALEMPWNVFTETAAVAATVPLPPVPAAPVDPDRIGDAVKLIRESRAPMIFVGSGAFGAEQEILELAERLGAPVVAFRSGRGIVSNAHELGLTVAEAYELWPQTDLAIGIGTRMEVPRWRWAHQPAGLRTIRIDIDPVEMRRAPPAVGIVADAKAATRALADALRNAGAVAADRHHLIRAARARTQVAIQEIQPQLAYLEVLREVLPKNGIVTDELSQVGFASWFGFPVYQPRTFISSGYQGNLGSGFMTALGAKVANPDTPVVAICGDGGFMFGVQELATAVQYRINVVTLVFNNNAYGNVRRDQLTGFDGRVVGANLVNPDFVALAESFGAAGARVATPAALRAVLERALSDDRPWLIEITVPRDSEASPWKYLHPAPPAAA
ncbi:MAG: thiamine pyrophosphate-dependent enzyme [Pseudomonadota bacterium]